MANRPCSEPSSNGDCARYRSICSDGIWGSSDVVDGVLELEQAPEACDEISGEEEEEEKVEDGVHTTRPASLSRVGLRLVVGMGQSCDGWKGR